MGFVLPLLGWRSGLSLPIQAVGLGADSPSAPHD
jgi:hypothetical protein